MNLFEKREDKKLHKEIWFIIGTTVFIFITFLFLILWIPTEQEKILFGIVDKNSCLIVVIEEQELEELHTWYYQNKKIEIEKVEEQQLAKEDGKKYQKVWIKLPLDRKQNILGNFVSLKITKKEKKIVQMKKILRSVID